SLLQTVGGQKGATQHFKLALRGAGGSLSGHVVDPDGKPIAHAIVVVGAEEKRLYPPEEQHGMSFSLLLDGTTDEAGAFRFPGVMAGTQPLSVRARGWAPWRQTITVNVDLQTEVDVHLDRGATLQGKVVDAGGASIRGVEISAG